MALQDLVARLEQEARAQVEAIERAASAEVRDIEAATEVAVRDAEARHLAREALARRQAHQRQLALLGRDLRARELDARQALVTRILERARQFLPDAAASPEYAAALPRHGEEALSYLDGLPARVRCASRFAALVAPLVDARPHVELAVDDALGPGLVAEAADGSVVVDNTLAARLSRAEPDLVIALARELPDGRR